MDRDFNRFAPGLSLREGDCVRVGVLLAGCDCQLSGEILVEGVCNERVWRNRNWRTGMREEVYDAGSLFARDGVDGFDR